MRQILIAFFIFCLAMGAATSPSFAKRVALVIGNDDYANVADLKKAVNDSETITNILEQVGFDVILAKNVTRRQFNLNLQKTVSKLEAGDEAVFFFAGHGIEIDGRNYLLPTDIPSASSGQESLIKGEAIAVDSVLAELRSRRPSVNVLILDACRDNPFESYGRTLGGTRGLARTAAPAGTFIMYSAGVGQTALDRISDDDPNPNSVYTRILAPMLVRPGFSLPKIARAVRREVELLAGSRQHLQRPAYYDELTGDYFLVPPEPNQESEKPEVLTSHVVPRIVKKPTHSATLANECDRLAADPYDKQAVADGVLYVDLAKKSLKAIRACRKAIAGDPESPRYMFQLGRSLDADKRYDDARKHYENAAAKGYAAARGYLGYSYEYGEAAVRNFEKAFQEYKLAADLGYVPAMHQISYLYLAGRGTDKDPKESQHWLLEAANGGFAPSMNAIGYAYDNGNGVPQDFAEAKRWYLKAIDAGDLTAMYNLAFMHEHGRGVDKNTDEALRWYRRSADQGFGAGLHQVGIFYEKGLSVAKDVSEALNWYRKAANAGNAAGMVKLGDALFSGQHTNKDQDSARNWFRKAAKKGNTNAMTRLASIYISGNGGPKDPAKGIEWYRKAASAGDSLAQNHLGYYHDNGKFVEQNYEKARHLYEQAAAKGNSMAMHNLGFMFANGRGVQKDITAARKWYYKAARRNNTLAIRHLAGLYYTGAGGQKDLAEALKWNRKAAELGDAVAMNVMGNMLSSGEGGEKDPRQARRWYEKSARGGSDWGMANFGSTLFGEKNYREAFKWFRKAADKNLPYAWTWLGIIHDFSPAGQANPPLAAQYIVRALKAGEKNAISQMTQNHRGRSAQFRRELQKLLRQAGLYSGRIDGSFGPSTLNAIRSLPQSQTKNSSRVLDGEPERMQ